jgi:hypothetical protein
MTEKKKVEDGEVGQDDDEGIGRNAKEGDSRDSGQGRGERAPVAAERRMFQYWLGSPLQKPRALDYRLQAVYKLVIERMPVRIQVKKNKTYKVHNCKTPATVSLAVRS